MDYLFLGHVTADRKPQGLVLGGTVSYSATIAHAFGCAVGLVTSCHADEPLVAPLRTIADLRIMPAPYTTEFENIYTHGQRQQILHHRANTLTLADVPGVWRATPFVHLAPVADELDVSLFHAFDQATLMLTPQGLMRQWDAEGRVRFRYWCDADALERVDIVVFSKQDIHEAPEIEFEYARLARCVIVTDGEHGGTIYQHGSAVPYRAYPANETDPTGAGDVFATTLLAALTHVGNDVVRAVDLAARVAAQSVQFDGVYIPDAATIRAILGA